MRFIRDSNSFLLILDGSREKRRNELGATCRSCPLEGREKVKLNLSETAFAGTPLPRK